jgi:hypothetical protein
MTSPSGPPEPQVHPRLTDSSRLFALVVVVEILSIAALYWFGRYFG